MEEMIKVNNNELQVKMWQGQRVVTLADIDRVHERADGTARRNFNANKNHLIDGEDFFKVCADEIRTSKIFEISPKVRGEIVLLTESGYLLLVKSFTDDLAWQVQRQLVNSYFRFKEVVETTKINTPMNVEELQLVLEQIQQNMPMLFSKITNLETSTQKQLEKLESVIENMTLTTRQQQKIAEAVRKRVNHLLGGAKSDEYKAHARSYMSVLWNNIKEKFQCGSSYKDLNPLCFDDAIEYISTWEYKK